MKMRKIVFATNNEHKLFEVQKMVSSDFEIISLAASGINEEVPEDQLTLEGNATQKADYIYEKLNVDIFADDTGLEIDALKGEPGVFSARYAGADKDANANMNKVLEKLQGQNNRKARFRTVICLIFNGERHLFEGIVEGEILEKLAGEEGFGYDPIFKPTGYDLSFAEMPLNEKNKISHRAKAVEKLINYLNTQQ